jgi:hypothetical protein
MSIDNINDEIRATRRRLAAQFDNNLSAIIEDLRARQETDGRIYITRPPRLVRREADEQNDAPKTDLYGSPDG